jgi:hypothetical protein
MKRSPRAWLLDRHQAAEAALNTARHTALNEALRPADNATVTISQLLPALFLPNRRLWTALAATWALLLAIHFSQRPPANASPAQTGNELAARTDSFLNRQAQLHALLR